MKLRDTQNTNVATPFDASANLLFMPALFQETMQIIFNSYEYFQVQEAMDDGTTPPHIHTLIANEMSRITMRLTSVMAWLMARKAVSAGQLSNAEAQAQYRIDAARHCLEHHGEYAQLLPEYLNELLEHSYQLYHRVWRLDQQFYGSSLK